MKHLFLIVISLVLLASNARADSKEITATGASIVSCIGGGYVGVRIADKAVTALQTRAEAGLFLAATAGAVGGCVAGVAGANYAVEKIYEPAPSEAELNQENSEE